MSRRRFLGAVATILVATTITACATAVPPYSERVETVDRLHAGGTGKVTVEPFGGEASVHRLRARADTFVSPYHESFTEYLQEALKAEFSRAGRFDPSAAVSIGGTLERNHLNVGVKNGSLEIAARFVVKRNGQIVYSQTHRARDEWPSSYFAAIAIPMARSRYPLALNQLLGRLFADPAFLEALK